MALLLSSPILYAMVSAATDPTGGVAGGAPPLIPNTSELNPFSWLVCLICTYDDNTSKPAKISCFIPMYNGFLKVTSGATSANPFVVIMAAEPVFPLIFLSSS